MQHKTMLRTGVMAGSSGRRRNGFDRFFTGVGRDCLPAGVWLGVTDTPEECAHLYYSVRVLAVL